jgi:methylglyoxal synthase
LGALIAPRRFEQFFFDSLTPMPHDVDVKEPIRPGVVSQDAKRRATAGGYIPENTDFLLEVM